MTGCGLLLVRLSASATEPQPAGSSHLVPEPPDPDNLPAVLLGLCGTELPTARSLLDYDAEGKPCQQCRAALVALADDVQRSATL